MPLIVLLGQVLGFVTAPGASRVWVPSVACLLWAAVVLAEPLLWFGVRVTPEALVLVGVRRRSVAWQLIQRIEATSALGLLVVDVFTQDGARIRLRAPTGSRWSRSRFEADVSQIMQLWSDRRGPHWTSQPLNPWARVGLSHNDPWRPPQPQ